MQKQQGMKGHAIQGQKEQKSRERNIYNGAW